MGALLGARCGRNWLPGGVPYGSLGGVDDSWVLFDRLADRYDEVIPFFATFAEQLVGLLDPVLGTRLLDVGAGRGAVAVAAAGRGCVVTAIDAAPRMVGLLAAAHPELDVRLMDAHGLDLRDASFDCVTGAFVIHLVRDAGRVLAEARRVLRAGGTVALTVPASCDDGGRWGGFNALVGEFEKRTDPERRPGAPIDVEQELAGAGFVDLCTAHIEVHLPVADAQTCWDFHMSHGFAGFVYSLGRDDRAEFRERAFAELDLMRAAGGMVIDRGATVHLATAPGPGAAAG